ncbi:E3 ubiquitin-protein ligase lubel isoform X1 [Stomoxys calcitrans]|uniref:E3 ubiquitin-protein ligase lubel isoform X1 n=1 Tax=Stomoxys calcitrans TaxID=35570 RepID=UPI0027E29438|nr:E3 ubiquitin-protein ligase lubel isoform X1 [Stomoxys calcitrans]
MESSCNNNRPQKQLQRSHPDDHDKDDRQEQHPQRQHRFTSSRMSRMKQFHKTLLATFVALALLMSHYQVLCVELTDNLETTTEDILVLVTTIQPQLSTQLDEIVEEKNETIKAEIRTIENLPPVEVELEHAPEGVNSDSHHGETHVADFQTTHDIPISSATSDIEQTEVNNEIFSSMAEVNPEVKTSHDFVNSEAGRKDVIETTEDLEQSIRNSVKTEMEEGLEPSPVLEILKDIAEPEIRQTLTEDLIEPTLNQNDVSPKLENKDSEDKVEDVDKTKDASPTQPEIPKEVSEIAEEAIEVKTHKVQEPKTKTEELNLENVATNGENTREARNLEVNVVQEDKKEDASVSSASTSSSESNSSQVPQESQVESGDRHDVTHLEITEEQQLSSHVEKVKETQESEVDLTIPKTIEEIGESSTTPPSDIAVLEEKETDEQANENDQALSVVLEESLSSTVAGNEDEPLTNVEQKEQKTSLDIIAEEETTSIPEETEHIVIKKVLDEQEIFAEVPDTTVFPAEVEKDQQPGVIIEVPSPTIIEEEMPKDLKENVSEEQSLINHEHDAENLNHHIPPVVLVEDTKEYSKVVIPQASVEDVDEQDDEDKNATLDTAKSQNDDSEEESSKQTADGEKHSKELDKKDAIQVPHQAIDNNSAEEEDDGQSDEDDSPAVVTSTESAAPTIHSEITVTSDHKHLSSSNTVSTTESAADPETTSESKDRVDDMPLDGSKTLKGSRSVNTALVNDDTVATMFNSYPPQDAGQTFNGNLADESAGIGKALPVTVNDGTNKSTSIIILSSNIAILFIVISVTIFLISFQRQHGTLDIEMQERSCGKDNLDEEDAETFAKLLEVELPPSVAIALEETEECL